MLICETEVNVSMHQPHNETNYNSMDSIYAGCGSIRLCLDNYLYPFPYLQVILIQPFGPVDEVEIEVCS